MEPETPPAWLQSLHADAISREPFAAGTGLVWVATLSFELWPGPPLGMTEDCNKRGGRVIGSGGELSCTEVEIAKRLRNQHWEGGWYNSFGGCGRSRWGEFMIGRQDLPVAAARLIDIIKAKLMRSGGVPDVIAWRRDQLIYVESKGRGDNTAKQQEWLAAAVGFGMDERTFGLVRWNGRATPLQVAETR